MLTFIYFILMLSFVIFIHEFGHFIVAKLFHVYVYEFALGMGPQILKWKGKETVYSIRLFPIGGFCAMAGEEQKDEVDNNIPLDRLMSSLNGFKKILIMVAGPVMNLVLAWVLFVGIFASLGYVSEPPLPIVNGISEGSPAQEAGFEYGDKITKVTFSDGSVLIPDDFYEIVEQTQLYHTETTYTVERNGETLDLTVTPKYDEEEKRYLVGIMMPQANVKQLDFVGAIQEGSDYFISTSKTMVVVIQKLFKGIGLDSLSGPVGIYSATEQQVKNGFTSFLALVGLISLNLGFVNLFPIPMFDGGRILITIVEMILHRRLPAKVENGLMIASMILVLALFVFITYNDVLRLL